VSLKLSRCWYWQCLYTCHCYVRVDALTASVPAPVLKDLKF
jgi:hypothetical protein